MRDGKGGVHGQQGFQLRFGITGLRQEAGHGFTLYEEKVVTAVLYVGVEVVGLAGEVDVMVVVVGVGDVDGRFYTLRFEVVVVIYYLLKF